MATNLNALYLNRLTQSQLDTITYEAGLDQNLVPSPLSFAAYQGSGTPSATVTGTGVGQPGTVYFSFDTTSASGFQFDAATRDNAAQALQMWSGLTNVTFNYLSDLTTAPAGFTRLLFVHSNDTSTYGGTSSISGAGTIERTELATGTSTPMVFQARDTFIQIDTTGGFGDFGAAAYTTLFGYGVGVLVHEVGHLVGLGHTGPYNGTVNEATQQNNSTDVRTWSIMSYIDPTTATAKYFADYVPAGVSWTDPVTQIVGNTYTPFTPMGLDIFAAQRESGAPTSAMFAGGQTFGFNSNVMYTALDGSQKKLSMYDFTIDKIPVVTLYDSGTNNTIDLSGFTTASSINLNDGTFSSAAALINNIFIEYGTQIDNAVGGAGDDVIFVNGRSDIIDGGGGTNVVRFADSSASWTLAAAPGGAISATKGGVTDTLFNISTLQFSDQAIAASSIACFAEGTRIRTPQGEVAVELLSVGDLVVTFSGRTRPITWLGSRTVRPSRHPRPETVTPVRIRAGAFGAGLPARDLMLSPEHAIFLEGVLIPVEALVNGHSVAPQAAERVTYWHVELDSHDVILAEGLPAESFLDSHGRAAFEGDTFILHPVFAASDQGAGVPCARMTRQGEVVEAVRQMLLRNMAFEKVAEAFFCEQKKQKTSH